MFGGGGNDNQDLSAMKELFNSWHVDILYDLFKEEDININELKMMHINHINTLLKNYKLGVRIRFEYNFNNWRNKIGLPLNSGEINHGACCCQYKINHVNSNIEESNNLKSNALIPTTITTNDIAAKRKKHHRDMSVDRTENDELIAPSTPQSGKSDYSLVKVLGGNEVINFAAVKSPQPQTNNTDDEADEDNTSLNILADILSSASRDEAPPKFPSKPSLEKCPVTLAQILQMSGNRGMSIVKFYKEKQRLTNIHRGQLIQTIVEFFDEKDYHLSLNVSHNLEWEILQMFPTEKLEYYRTEKRGKIYVKYGNMKRYKRERSIKVRTEIDSFKPRIRRSHRAQYSNEMDGVEIEEGSNFDVWPICAEAELNIKAENDVQEPVEN